MAETTRGGTPTVDPKSKEDLHAMALRHADEAWRQEYENVTSGRDCQRFYIGGEAQWDAEALARRKAANRPALTMNRGPSFVRQLTGEVRQNPPSIKVLPAKDGATIEAADIFNGLIRNIEQQSVAKAAYTKAVENAAIAGIGGWYVVTEYSSDDAFDQDIRIKRSSDPFQLLVDPNAQEPDKSDMGFGFIFSKLTKEAYIAKYPKFPADSIPANVANQGGLSWRTTDTVTIAQYWYRTPIKKTLQLYDDGTVRYADDKLEEGQVLGSVSQEREVVIQQIRSCVISGKDIIEDPVDWAGRYIPICVVVGEEITADGTTVRKGMMHDMRDPQRVYNYTRTAAVEAVAMQPKSPFILTADQASGYETQWANAGSDNLAALIYKGDPKAQGAPARSQPPIASTGLDVQSQLAISDLEGVSGIYKAGLGAPSNETSGRAILARQNEGDTGTYHYIDNLGIAIGYCGRILVDLIPKIYDATRVVRTLGEDDSAKMVKINEPTQDQTGRDIVLNDLSAGEYDVVVSTGPSFATKRAEASTFMTELVRGFPQITEVAGDIIIENMDVPGASKIAARMKKAMGIGEDGEPIEQEQKQDPAVAAKALKDAASVDKIKAETDKTELENAQLAANLATVAQALPQIMAIMQQITQAQQPGGAPPEAMPPEGMQPPAPPMGGGMQPPQAEMMPPTAEMGGDMPSDLPPTVEIGAATVPA